MRDASLAFSYYGCAGATGQPKSGNDKVLSVFDQRHRDKPNSQLVNLDGSNYENDVEMMHIIHRLTAATVNAELRDQMNTEDLYTSVLEKRDTDIMIRNAMIAEQDRIIAEKDEQLRALEKLMC